jgi:hypothetical protein
MPLARIDLAEGKAADYRSTISEVVCDAPEAEPQAPLCRVGTQRR